MVDLKAEERWTAIDELVGHLVVNQKIKAEDKVFVVACVKKREAAMSTGIGFGVAMPHTSTTMVSEILVVIGRSRKGIQFDSLDGKPVHLVFLFLVPTGEFQKYVNTLAILAKMLHRADFRDGLWGRCL